MRQYGPDRVIVAEQLMRKALKLSTPAKSVVLMGAKKSKVISGISLSIFSEIYCMSKFMPLI